LSDYSEIITDLLLLRRAEPSATDVFKRWKHDEHLCPKLREKIELAFSAFKKYHTITHDIQGLKDEGTDILLTEWVNDRKQFVCFQIKGEWDLAQKGYLETLKAQHFNTRNRYGDKLKAYYIIVCCSIVTNEAAKRRFVTDKKRLIPDKKKIEQVKAIVRAFAPEDKVRVIEPEYAIRFLTLTSLEIDSSIRIRYGEDDIVFKEARALVRGLAPTETVLLVFVLWLRLYKNKQLVSMEEITRSAYIQRMHEFIFEQLEYDLYNFEDQIAHDIEILEDAFIDVDTSGDFSLSLQAVQALAILMMDGNVRYGYEEEELLEYTIEILGGFSVTPEES